MSGVGCKPSRELLIARTKSGDKSKSIEKDAKTESRLQKQRRYGRHFKQGAKRSKPIGKFSTQMCTQTLVPNVIQHQ